MVALAFVPLRTADAQEYWGTFLEGRTDVPTRELKDHVERYLALPPADRRSHLTITADGRPVGTIRLLHDTISVFSMVPGREELWRPSILKAVDALRTRSGGAITASYEDRYGPAFEALGFRPRFARMRMEAATRAAAPRPDHALKPPEESEVPGLATFLRDVYDGHVEQAFGIHVGTDAEWQEYVTGVLKGDAGRFMPEASFVALDGTRIYGAILLTHWMGSPLVAELGVARDRRGKGLGRALLESASNRLLSLGEPRWSLYVTAGNDAAIRLYGALGFVQAGGRTVTSRLEPA